MSTLPPNPITQSVRKKITTLAIRQKKVNGEPITMLTGYDYPTGLALDQAGIDAILVGDSLGMVVLGYENTLPVTMDVMLHHCRAVARGAKIALLIGDMPFMSYQASTEEAVRNAGRFLQEAGMDAIKLEGGRERLNAVHAIIGAGIPVMGHLGLTPQSVHMMGGFRPQGRTATSAERLLEDALLLEQEGIFSLVLESVPARLAEMVSKRLSIPTIGIGAGGGCDGQVLVSHDLLGLFDRFTPKFVRKYANLHAEMDNAFKAFIADVQNRDFPAKEHTVEMPDEEWEAFVSHLDHREQSGGMKSNSILIIGTGALATLFAARSAKAGIPVTMLGTWIDGLNAINEKGVRVEGEGKAYRVRATANPAECKGMRIALVLVKAWQTERAAHQLSDCLDVEGVALSLQNGLGNDTKLAATLGNPRVSQGVTTLGATLNAPGEVCQGGEGPVSLAPHPRLAPVEKMMREAGFEVSVVNNIQSLIWGKLVVSSALNPLTALLRVKNGELLERPEALALMGELARETAEVAQNMGILLPFKNPERAVEEVAIRTAENLSSMLQDILRGAPTEIDAINGAVVQLAEMKALQVPVNRIVWSLIKAIPVRGNIKM